MEETGLPKAAHQVIFFSYASEVYEIVRENGAGKSTLGAIEEDEGEIYD